jgi:hypothetical protein
MDMDDIPPGTDIDLPQDKPALPSAENNALPVAPVQATTPPESAMPPPAPVDVPEAPKPSPKVAKMPEGTVKVIDPETGEVTHLSPNGSVVNPATGGEVFAATEEQQALQARAREIAAQAEAKPAPAPAKRVAKAVKKAAPAEAPQFTEEQIKRGQALHMVAKEQNVETSLLRDVIAAVTKSAEHPQGRTRSSREVSQDEADTIRAIVIAIGQEMLELSYTEDGMLEFETIYNDLPPDDAEEDIPDAEVVPDPVDWKAVCAEKSVKDGMFLRKARALAEELGLPLPSSFKDISGDKLEAALWDWLTVLNA